MAIKKTLVERNGSAERPVKVRTGLPAGELIKEGEDFLGRNVIMAASFVASGGVRHPDLRRQDSSRPRQA